MELLLFGLDWKGLFFGFVRKNSALPSNEVHSRNSGFGHRLLSRRRTIFCGQRQELPSASRVCFRIARMVKAWSVAVTCSVVVLCIASAGAWTGEIHGKVVCDVCGDSFIGAEDHVLEGAEVAVLCITKSGEVINYQAFTNSKGTYTIAETMPESERWASCLARSISSFHQHCTRRGKGHSATKFSYDLPSGHSHTVRPFIYRPDVVPAYCI